MSKLFTWFINKCYHLFIHEWQIVEKRASDRLYIHCYIWLLSHINQFKIQVFRSTINRGVHWNTSGYDNVIRFSTNIYLFIFYVKDTLDIYKYKYAKDVDFRNFHLKGTGPKIVNKKLEHTSGNAQEGMYKKSALMGWNRVYKQKECEIRLDR